MLEGLDAVDWHSLTHAYGAASDVPALLRDLASPSSGVRSKSLWELYGNIWHQGTVYEATSHAVPFLIELAASPAVPEREQILVLLIHLANGHSYLDVHQSIPLIVDSYLGGTRSSEFQHQLAKELDWVRAAHAAVADGTPTYLRLLADEDAVVRAAAAFLLSCFGAGSRGREIYARLVEHLRVEAEARARSGLAFGLGRCAALLHAAQPDAHDVRVDCAERLSTMIQSIEEPGLARVVAAISLSLVASVSPRYERIAAHALLDALVRPNKEIADSYAALPWVDEGIAGDISASLAQLKDMSSTEELAPALLAALQAADPLTALTIAHAALSLAFGAGLASDAASLTPAQRSILVHMANPDAPCWKINANMANLLRAFGLPDWPDKVQAFLAST